MKKLLTVKVTNRFFAKAEAEGWADHAISLVDPGVQCDIPGVNQHIEFFEDLEDPSSKAPTREHIERALAFSSNFLDGQNILVHCEGGICRSTAMAILIHCQAGFSPEEALKRVERVRPQLWPNRLIISHGDDILGLNGELVEVVRHFRDTNANKIFIGGELEE